MDSDPANSADPNRCALEDAPFEELVRTDPDLRNFRKEYAAKSPATRRKAAESE